MNKMVDMLQTQQQLKSLHGKTKETKHKVCDTKEPKRKVTLATCELELFYFDDVVAPLNEGLDDELQHIKDKLNNVAETTNNGQRTNNNIEADENKSTKFIRP